MQEAERLRLRSRTLFSDIRKFGDKMAMASAEEVLPNRRPSMVQKFDRLKQVADALESVWEGFSTEASRGENSHRCDIPLLPNANKENINKTCRAANHRDDQPIRTTPAHVASLASEPFQELIEVYWSAVDNGSPISWRTIQMAARDRADQLEINSDVWQRQYGMLGEERTALCLMIADRNSERLDGYRVRDAAAAFIGMARLEARQGAVINSLLGELIGNVGGQRRDA